MTMRSARLDEICQINPPTPVEFSSTDVCSFVPMEAVDDYHGQVGKKLLRPYSAIANGYTVFAEKDVIVAKITPCMENGKCAVARNLRRSIGFGSTDFHVLRASDQVLPEWLYFFWRLPATRRRAAHNMTGSAGQKRVSARYLESLTVPLPTAAEQQRIVGILERADRLRRLRRFALEVGDGFLASAFLRSFVSEEKNYPLVPVEELAIDRKASIRTGPFGSQLLHSEFTDRGIAVLGIDNAVQNRFAWDERRFITEAKYAQLKRYTVLPGDVIITIMGTCGRCAVVPSDIPAAINTKHLCCISLDQKICMSNFLHACFLHHPSVLRSLGVFEKGAIMPGLNMEIIKALPIPLPPMALQQQFAALIERHERLRQVHREALRQAEHLFQTLLHRAFTTGL